MPIYRIYTLPIDLSMIQVVRRISNPCVGTLSKGEGLWWLDAVTIEVSPFPYPIYPNSSGRKSITVRLCDGVAGIRRFLFRRNQVHTFIPCMLALLKICKQKSIVIIHFNCCKDMFQYSLLPKTSWHYWHNRRNEETYKSNYVSV